MVGAPDNRITVLVRTCSDAPGQYIRPFPVFEPVITAHQRVIVHQQKTGHQGAFAGIVIAELVW